MERVPTLVKQGAKVAVHPDCVHKNEWNAIFLEGGLIAAGGFPLTVCEVEEIILSHELKLGI
jgi:hypothetical protein